MLRYFLFTGVGVLALIALYPVMKAVGSSVSKYFRKVDIAADEVVSNNDEKEDKEHGKNSKDI